MSKRKDDPQQLAAAVAESADDPLLTAAQVAKLFYVAQSTAWRWAAEGKIPSVRTPGGPRKVRLSDVKAVLGEVAHAQISSPVAAAKPHEIHADHANLSDL